MANCGKVKTHDGVNLWYDEYNRTAQQTIVLIHGWSGSRRYWSQNARELAAAGFRVVTYDQRHHGDSDKPAQGFSVYVLAADLRAVLSQLEVRNACCVGASMGAAVLWAFHELFGTEGRIGSIVTVDQAPLQNIAPDWRLGSTGCYDIASLTRLQDAIMFDFPKFAAGNASFCCDEKMVDRKTLEMLAEETLKASKEGLCKLMADHTARDWRPVLANIAVPCLNVVGLRSRVFVSGGVEAVSTFLRSSQTVRTEIFERGEHWLYIEESERFNTLVVEFAKSSF